MEVMNRIFDAIGRTITSLAAVIFVMLMTITGMILFSHTLFAQIFPAGMDTVERKAATWFMALGWEFTVLITTCNTKHINRNIPAIMAICSGIIVLFFIQAFDVSQHWLTLLQRVFVGLLAATINYIYAELFYAKWKERRDIVDFPAKLNELKSALTDSERKFIELQSEHNQQSHKLNATQKELGELQRFKQKIDSELTCPYCKVIQPFGTLHAHKGHCSENPKNKN